MAANKKSTYISEELIWLEKRVWEIKADVDAHPYNKLRDRTVTLSTPTGDKEVVVANIEAQKKSLREAYKEYAQLIEVIDKLREKEEAKIEARGKSEIPPDQMLWMQEKR